MGIKVDDELCTGCESSVSSCPYGSIEIINNKAHISDECTLCGACVDVCTENAIILEREKFKIEKMDIRQGRLLDDHLGAVALGDAAQGDDGHGREWRMVKRGARIYLS